MNRIRQLLLLALMGLITACSYNELPEEFVPQTIYEEDGLVLNVETRAETYNGQVLDQEHFVTAEDLANFVKYRRSASKRSDLAVKEVKSYGFDSSQTLFYILNYDKGWEVVSADKRVQPTLAHGDSGEFTMECDNESMKFWMNMLADGILQTRLGNFDKKNNEATASAESKEATDDSQSDHTAFWDAISPTSTSRTRLDILVPTPGPVDPGYYTYLVDSEVETNVVYQIGPLLSTEWHQGSPWNSYCPPKNDGSSGHVPAGCVAIAGAQVLYYYHYFFDMDNLAPATAIANGTLSDWNILFGGFSSTTWDEMAKKANESFNKKQKTALFIAHIGNLVNMDYGNDGSGAYTTSLPNLVFSEYGISCSTALSYDSDIIIQNIIDRLPVVIKGRDNVIINDGDGHAWVIDGYQRTYDKITNYYAVFDTVQLPSYIATLDKDDADYSSSTTTTTMKKVHMDWGWQDGDGFFSLIPSEWIQQGQNCGYEYHIKMLHDFAVIE